MAIVALVRGGAPRGLSAGADEAVPQGRALAASSRPADHAAHHRRVRQRRSVADLQGAGQRLQRCFRVGRVGGVHTQQRVAGAHRAAQRQHTRQADARVERVAGALPPAAQRDDRPGRARACPSPRARRRAAPAARAAPARSAAARRRAPARRTDRRARRPCARSVPPRCRSSSARSACSSPSAGDGGQPAQPQHAAGQRQRQRQQARLARRAGEEVDRLAHLDARCRRCVPSTWFMSVTSACVGRPAPTRHLDQAARQRVGGVGVGAEGAVADLHVHHQRVAARRRASSTGCWR